MELLEAVDQAGLVATIVFGLMGYALRWFVKERDRVLGLLDVANADRLALREKRADDLEKAANEYRDFGDNMREVIREWTGRMQSLESKQDVFMATFRGLG